MHYHRAGHSLPAGSVTPIDEAYTTDSNISPQSPTPKHTSWARDAAISLKEVQQPDQTAQLNRWDPALDEDWTAYNPKHPARWTVDGSGRIEQQAFEFFHHSSPKPLSIIKKPKLVLPSNIIINTKDSRYVSNVNNLRSAAVEYDSDYSWDEPSVKQESDLEASLPDKIHGKTKWGIWYLVISCHRLLCFIGFLNIIAAVAIIASKFPRPWLETMTVINVTIAILIRQDLAVNTIYRIVCSVPKNSPLWFRQRCAKMHDLGGVYAGAALAAALWLLANTIGDAACIGTSKCSGSWGKQSAATQAVSWLLTAGFTLLLVSAYPAIRKKHRDVMEDTHRFVEWTMIALFWAYVVLNAKDTKPESSSLGKAVVQVPSFWLLIFSTLGVSSSWFWLKRFPVQAEILSRRSVRLHFDHEIPPDCALTQLSYKPLTQWHSFATIRAPVSVDGRHRGYSIVVSQAGDWAQSTVQNPPKHIWVRGLPVYGVMRMAALFQKIVIVCTGSGIAAMLDHIEFSSIPTRLLWSARDPEETYGDKICHVIRSRLPDSVIHNTAAQGRPDLLKMSYNMARKFDAEAVFVISNDKTTKHVVHGLETRGVVAFGLSGITDE